MVLLHVCVSERAVRAVWGHLMRVVGVTSVVIGETSSMLDTKAGNFIKCSKLFQRSERAGMSQAVGVLSKLLDQSPPPRCWGHIPPPMEVSISLIRNLIHDEFYLLLGCSESLKHEGI